MSYDNIIPFCVILSTGGGAADSRSCCRCRWAVGLMGGSGGEGDISLNDLKYIINVIIRNTVANLR